MEQTIQPITEQPKPSLWLLFRTFVLIGSFTFGGGYAMIPLIIKEVVERFKWVTNDEFVDMLSVAQSLPGVFAVNISMFIGHKVRRSPGAIIAAIGTTLPSFIIILLLALFFEQASHNPIVASVMSGIRPAVVAMIVVPVITVWRALKLPNSMIVIPIVVAIGVWYFGISPIWVIVAAALIGILYTFIKHRHVKQ